MIDFGEEASICRKLDEAISVELKAPDGQAVVKLEPLFRPTEGHLTRVPEQLPVPARDLIVLAHCHHLDVVEQHDDFVGDPHFHRLFDAKRRDEVRTGKGSIALSKDHQR